MSIAVAVADDSLRERVLDTAVELGRGLGEELYVVHLTADDLADVDAQSVRDDVREYLAAASVEFSVAIEHVEHTAARSGTTVGRQLGDITSDVAVSHAVVGHRSKELLGSVVEGSTAFTLADTAAVPVTVVPESASE
ncbi:MAG: universal stress protein [Halolamina sp.]